MRDRTHQKSKRLARRWSATLAAMVIAPAALACSTVALGPGSAPVIAYSYDQSETGAGFVVINPEGATRRSIMPEPAADWETRHASVTFNQFGPGMPAAGMNAAGLVVTLMWNDTVAYPPPRGRPMLNELEMIQRLLDTSGTVDEALSALGEVDVIGMVPIHLFLADAGGAVAAVRPAPDGFVIRRSDEMPVRALTNASYAELIEGIEAFEGFGGSDPMPVPAQIDNPTSLERFAIAGQASRDAQHPVSDVAAFDVLEDLNNPQMRWQIVFRPTEGQIAFRTDENAAVSVIAIDALDVTCRPQPQVSGMARPRRDGAPPAFSPLDDAMLETTLEEVLDLFPEEFGLGPELAGEMAVAQLGAITC